MNALQNNVSNFQHELTIFEQWRLHFACYRRDYRFIWHLRGCWRPVSTIVKGISAGILFVSLF